MFERYTESARRPLFFARYAVTELGAVSIETDHLLLGLIRLRKGIVARIFEERGINPEDLRRDLEQRTLNRPSIATSVEVPFGPDTKRALEHAKEEADRLLHNYIGTEHLLLGLLRDEHSVAGSTLAARGLRLEDARELVLTLLGEGPQHAQEEGVGYSAERADASSRIDAIRALVRQLAEAAPDSPELRQLADRIGEHLDVLTRHFGGSRPHGEVK